MRWWGKFLPLALLTLVVLLSAQSPSGASQNLRADQHKDGTKNDPERGDNSHEAVTSAFLAIHDAEISLREALKTINLQAEAQAKQNHTAPESWHSPAMLAQIGLIVVGLAYTFFACRQWLSMRESLQVSERAYVNVSRIDVIAPETLDALLFARTVFVIRNSGKTPARHLLVEVSGEIVSDARGEKIPTDTESIWRTPFEGMTLPPDTEHRMRFDFPDAFIKADKVRVGELYAVCWATISYEDQFGVSHDSIEPFYYDPVAQTFDRHYIGFRESSRRYRKAGSYQWKIRSWFRALIKRSD